MPNYVEMIRLFEAGFSLRQTAKLVSSGRNTVSESTTLPKTGIAGSTIGLGIATVLSVFSLFAVSKNVKRMKNKYRFVSTIDISMQQN